MFYPIDEYLKLPREPQPWVVDKLVPVGGLVNVFGKPKTGKSFVALGLAEAIANEEPEWEGFEIKKHGNVAYLQVDTPREEWSARAERVSQVGMLKHKIWMADMWTVPEFPFNILNPVGTELTAMKNKLAEIKPVMVVIDTLREIHNGDENDSTVMRNVIANLVAACRPAAIILVSHSRKDSVMSGGDEDLMDQQRGSSYVSGRMDVIVKITPKRMIFKGRATGQQTLPITQDKETGFIHVDRAQETAVQQTITALKLQHPGDSEYQLAVKLSHESGISLSTAQRRLKAYHAGR